MKKHLATVRERPCLFVSKVEQKNAETSASHAENVKLFVNIILLHCKII